MFSDNHRSVSIACATRLRSRLSRQNLAISKYATPSDESGESRVGANAPSIAREWYEGRKAKPASLRRSHARLPAACETRGRVVLCDVSPGRFVAQDSVVTLNGRRPNDFVGYGILSTAPRPLTIRRKKSRATSAAKLNAILIAVWALVICAGQTLPISLPTQCALPPKAVCAARMGRDAQSRSRHRLADAESFAK